MKQPGEGPRVPLKTEATKRKKVASPEEAEVEEEKEKEKGKEEGEAQKKTWWKKCQEFIISLKMLRKEKESKRREIRLKARQTLEKFAKWLFLFLPLGQNWECVSAAAEGTAEKDGGDGKDAAEEVQVKEGRWMEEIPRRWRQPKGEDRLRRRRQEL